MKTTKFRVYDFHTRLMTYGPYLVVDHESGLVSAYPESEFNSPLMQYTGLQDKNGVEIYEEDIVKCVWKASPKADGEYGYNDDKYIEVYYHVLWGDGYMNEQHRAGFWTKIIKWVDVNGCTLNPHSMRCNVNEEGGFSLLSEVIGNIYENSELLHDTK